MNKNTQRKSLTCSLLIYKDCQLTVTEIRTALRRDFKSSEREKGLEIPIPWRPREDAALSGLSCKV